MNRKKIPGKFSIDYKEKVYGETLTWKRSFKVIFFTWLENCRILNTLRKEWKVLVDFDSLDKLEQQIVHFILLGPELGSAEIFSWEKL